MEWVKVIRQKVRERWADFLIFLKFRSNHGAFKNRETPFQPRNLSQKSLATTAMHLRETIANLEGMLVEGRWRALEKALSRDRLAHVVGPRVREVYCQALRFANPGSAEFRQRNVSLLFDLFFQSLRSPGRYFEAEAKTHRNRYGYDSIIGATVQHNGLNRQMRLDQLLSALRWGIGFRFESIRMEDLLAIERFSQAVSLLSLGLAGIQNIQNLVKETPTNLRVFPEPTGYQFEQLMIDILNEHRRLARRAPLIEDFFEKTDLRYKNPELGRRRGARIQVTYTIQPDFHEEKLAKIKRPDELIILSPLALANSLKNMREAFSERLQVGNLWDCVGKVATVPEFAESLRSILLKALEDPHSSPLGPAGAVPEPIRELIRVFVDLEAFRSTRALRSREKKYGPAKTIRHLRRRNRKRLHREERRHGGAPPSDEGQRTQA